MLIESGEFPGEIVLSAHDEIIVECASQDTQVVQDLLSQVMISVAQNILSSFSPELAPVHVDLGIGDSWAAKP